MDVIAFDEDGQMKPHPIEDNYLCGGFLFLNSTTRTLALWRELADVHRIQMGLEPRKQEYAFITKEYLSSVNWGNEQNTFSELTRREVRSGRLSMGWLPLKKFRSGRWLGKVDIEEFMIIHANFIIGVEQKISSLRAANLWFVEDPNRCRKT
jgi:hypothetical protein